MRETEGEKTSASDTWKTRKTCRVLHAPHLSKKKEQRRPLRPPEKGMTLVEPAPQGPPIGPLVLLPLGDGKSRISLPPAVSAIPLPWKLAAFFRDLFSGVGPDMGTKEGVRNRGMGQHATTDRSAGLDVLVSIYQQGNPFWGRQILIYVKHPGSLAQYSYWATPDCRCQDVPSLGASSSEMGASDCRSNLLASEIKTR